MSKRMDIYYGRKAAGLCVHCGDPAADGKTRCVKCARFEAMRAKKYRDNLDDDKRAARRKKENEWRKAHPERVAAYNARKSEYNRRYEEKI